MADIDLNFLSRQNERILNEMQMMRADITVLTGITIRLEGAVIGLVEEIRGMRSQIANIDRRVHKLEENAEQ